MSKIYPKVYFKNKIVDFSNANLSIANSAVLYGLSTYTVIPLFLSADKNHLNVFKIKEHYKRLRDSAKIIGFNDFLKNWDEKKFTNIVIKTIKSNSIKQDSLIRITLFADEILSGAKSYQVKNSLSIFIYQMEPLIKKRGANLIVSSWRRNPDLSLPARAKINGSYVNAALMKNEALALGYDDAIALDYSGHVSESTVSNIFIVKDNFLITPSDSSDLLEGITRKTVLEIAQKLGIKTIKASIDRTELYLASEVFLCGSSMSIFPVFKIDNVLINEAKIGQITKQISYEYFKMLRSNNANKDQILSIKV